MTPTPAICFQATLRPHRSLPPEYATKLIIGLAILFALASLRLCTVGAWPVIGFLVLDIAALGVAFYINFRRARVQEDICLTDSLLVVRRTSASGQVESWAFEPYWVKLSLEKNNKHDHTCALSLHDQRVTLGQFLTENQRTRLYEDLQDALTRRKNK